MRHIKAEVRRSELSTIGVEVLPWDIPVLENMHGVENVTVHGETDKPAIFDGAQAEYARLESAYGKDTETNQTWVGQTYGVGPIGVAKLTQFIEEQKDGDSLAR